MEDIMTYITRICEIETLGTAADGVEMMTRTHDEKVWLFVINHTADEQVYHLHGTYTLLEGGRAEFLQPYEVQLFEGYKRRK